MPGTGAKLNIDMVGTVGSAGMGLLPTGHPTDAFDIPRLRQVGGLPGGHGEPCLFIRAADVGLTGKEVKKADFAPGKLELLETIRKEVFRVLGKPPMWSGMRCPLWPLQPLPPTTWTT